MEYRISPSRINMRPSPFNSFGRYDEKYLQFVDNVKSVVSHVANGTSELMDGMDEYSMFDDSMKRRLVDRMDVFDRIQSDDTNEEISMKRRDNSVEECWRKLIEVQTNKQKMKEEAIDAFKFDKLYFDKNCNSMDCTAILNRFIFEFINRNIKLSQPTILDRLMLQKLWGAVELSFSHTSSNLLYKKIRGIQLSSPDSPQIFQELFVKAFASSYGSKYIKINVETIKQMQQTLRSMGWKEKDITPNKLINSLIKIIEDDKDFYFISFCNNAELLIEFPKLIQTFEDWLQNPKLLNTFFFLLTSYTHPPHLIVDSFPLIKQLSKQPTLDIQKRIPPLLLRRWIPTLSTRTPTTPTNPTTTSPPSNLTPSTLTNSTPHTINTNCTQLNIPLNPTALSTLLFGSSPPNSPLEPHTLQISFSPSPPTILAPPTTRTNGDIIKHLSNIFNELDNKQILPLLVFQSRNRFTISFGGYLNTITSVWIEIIQNLITKYKQNHSNGEVMDMERFDKSFGVPPSLIHSPLPPHIPRIFINFMSFVLSYLLQETQEKIHQHLIHQIQKQPNVIHISINLLPSHIIEATTTDATQRSIDNIDRSLPHHFMGYKNKLNDDKKFEVLMRQFEEITINAPNDASIKHWWNECIEAERRGWIFEHNKRLLNKLLDAYHLKFIEFEVLKDCLSRIPFNDREAEQLFVAAIKIEMSYQNNFKQNEWRCDKKRFPYFPLETLRASSVENAFFDLWKGRLNLSNEAKIRDKSEIAALASNKHERLLLPNVILPQDMNVRYSEIGGLQRVKQLLKECITYPLMYTQLYTEGLCKEAVKGVLLFGPPGTGKTMLAKAVATEGGAAFLSIDASTIENMWLGESEKMAKAVFTLARKLAPCVIYIDEVDSLLSSRDRGDSAHNTLTSLKTTLMAEWDGLRTTKDRVIVIASTNRPFALDEAVLRRVPRRVLVDLPDMLSREQILKVTLRDNRVASPFNHTRISTLLDGYTGSDIKEVCREAVTHLANEKAKWLEEQLSTTHGEEHPPNSMMLREITEEDVEEAMKKVGASVDTNGKEIERIWQWNDRYGEVKRTPNKRPLWPPQLAVYM